MFSLNLPTFKHKITKREGDLYIFDMLRKKHLKLTPEEWVRQHFINYLIFHLGYPKNLIRSEASLKFNNLSKRADIIVYAADLLHPLIVVECKAPFVPLTDEVWKQASAYAHTLQPRYVCITNGMEHFYVKTGAELEKIDGLPAAKDIFKKD